MDILVQNLGTIFTAILGWAGSVVSFITSNPLLLVFVGIGLLGMSVNLVKSFLR